MGLVGYDLSQYPLDEHYRACQQYIRQSMDWNKISASIRKCGTIGIDVSDVISLFGHLELDSEYRLICYMTSEYHGIFGKVAAVNKKDDWHPKYDAGKDFHPYEVFNKLHMPDCALPPMEAIFNDGSAGGCFEAVLCALFLHTFPYERFEQKRRLVILNAAPGDYEEKWDAQIVLADWNPRYTERSVIALERKLEDGIGSSDGKDQIYLTQFHFYRTVNESLLASVIRTRQPAALNHIKSSHRYSERKKCCVFSQSSVLVATERES